jgi:ribosomal protein S18 acetylase RimI-like enzyme
VNVTYRQATLADEEFLYQLHRAAMRRSVEETWGAWDEGWQRSTFREYFHPETLRVIQLDGQDVGVLWVETRAEELFVSRLEILPVYQRRGIGTAVMLELAEEAARLGKPVALKVLKANRGARDLYQRLGFGVTGETDTHYVMARETRAIKP